MSTTLTNGIIIPDNGSRNWGGDLANNWNIIDVNVGYMTDVKNRVTTLENSVAENTANIQINASNISALQTSKQDTIEDLETIRAGASAGATAVQPSALSNYYDKAEVDAQLVSKANDADVVHKSSNETIDGIKVFSDGANFSYTRYIVQSGGNLTEAYSKTIDSNYSIVVADVNTFARFDFSMNYFCSFRGDDSNGVNLGTPANKWKDIYATNATINTSDRNAKTCIENIADNLLDAWGNVSLVSFKFKDAIEKKGANARIHAGYIAQNIQEELYKHGIDACNYGLFCYDSWDAQEEKSHEEEKTDREGNANTVKVIDTPAISAGATYGLRYIECLVVECAYLRKKNRELADRIAKLENKLQI